MYSNYVDIFFCLLPCKTSLQDLLKYRSKKQNWLRWTSGLLLLSGQLIFFLYVRKV